MFGLIYWLDVFSFISLLLLLFSLDDIFQSISRESSMIADVRPKLYGVISYVIYLHFIVVSPNELIKF